MEIDDIGFFGESLPPTPAGMIPDDRIETESSSRVWSLEPK